MVSKQKLGLIQTKNSIIVYKCYTFLQQKEQCNSRKTEYTIIIIILGLRKKKVSLLQNSIGFY